MKMNNLTKLICATGLCSALLIPADVSAQNINLGDALKPAMEAMARQMAEALQRRWSMSPDEAVMPSTDSILTITLTNNYKDSARALIRVHSSPPPEIIMADTTVKQHAGEKRSLIADDSLDDSAAIYKDLTPLLTAPSNEIRLAPGETKSITVMLRVPLDAASGEYAAWVASHVVIDPSREGVKPDTLTSTAGIGSGGEGKYKAVIQGANILNTLRPGTEVVSSTKIVVKK